MEQTFWLAAYWTACALGAGLSVCTWIGIGVRFRQARRLVPYEVRRGVPWRFKHVLLIVLLFEAPLLLSVLDRFGRTSPSGQVAARSPLWPESGSSSTASREQIRPLLGFSPGNRLAGSFGETRRQQVFDLAEVSSSELHSAKPKAERAGTYHPVFELLRGDNSPGTWLLCVVVVALIAPIVEELVFRLVVVGWLAKAERLWRRRVVVLRRVAPGWLPVVLVSLWFAAQHARTAGEPLDPRIIRTAIIVTGGYQLLTGFVALLVLLVGCGATLRELGVSGSRLGSDLRLGVVAFLAVGPPIMALQDLLTRFVVPNTVAADPIPLFLFAMALGGLYYRTGRIVPSIVVHMLLNASSLFLAWIAIRAGLLGTAVGLLW